MWHLRLYGFLRSGASFPYRAASARTVSAETACLGQSLPSFSVGAAPPTAASRSAHDRRVAEATRYCSDTCRLVCPMAPRAAACEIWGRHRWVRVPSGTLRLGRLRTATTADEVAFYWQTPVGSSALWQPEQHAQHTLNTEYHGKYDSLSRLRERDSDSGAYSRLFYLSHLLDAQLRRVVRGAGKRGDARFPVNYPEVFITGIQGFSEALLQQPNHKNDHRHNHSS